NKDRVVAVLTMSKRSGETRKRKSLADLFVEVPMRRKSPRLNAVPAPATQRIQQKVLIEGGAGCGLRMRATQLHRRLVPRIGGALVALGILAADAAACPTGEHQRWVFFRSVPSHLDAPVIAQVTVTKLTNVLPTSSFREPY